MLHPLQPTPLAVRAALLLAPAPTWAASLAMQPCPPNARPWCSSWLPPSRPRGSTGVAVTTSSLAAQAKALSQGALADSRLQRQPSSRLLASVQSWLSSQKHGGRKACWPAPARALGAGGRRPAQPGSPRWHRVPAGENSPPEAGPPGRWRLLRPRRPRLGGCRQRPEVAEAVAWLQARDLPPQRPLVETVAAWISQDRNALPAAGRPWNLAVQLPSALLEGPAQPGPGCDRGLQAALAPGQPEPRAPGPGPTALRRMEPGQGLDLESRLDGRGSTDVQWSHGGGRGSQAAGTAPAPGSGPHLLRLEGELRLDAIRENGHEESGRPSPAAGRGGVEECTPGPGGGASPRTPCPCRPRPPPPSTACTCPCRCG